MVACVNKQKIRMSVKIRAWFPPQRIRVLTLARAGASAHVRVYAVSSFTMCCVSNSSARVSAAKPRLPSLGFEYEPEVLQSILQMSPSVLFGQHPDCGSLPLALISNHAGRNGRVAYNHMLSEMCTAPYCCLVPNICLHVRR